MRGLIHKHACQPASMIHLQSGGADLAEIVTFPCSGSAILHASSQGRATHLGHRDHGGCRRSPGPGTGTSAAPGGAVRRRELPV